MNANAPTLQQLMKEGKISSKTMERVQIAKSYIEKKYRMKKVQEEEKKKDWDVFNKKMEELNLSSKEKEIIKKDVIKKEAEILRQGRKKISIREFESLAIIGRGAFGEVRVCREIATGEIVAIKKMRKEDMYQKNQIMHVRTEKEILISAKSPWVVNLRYSFQDEYFLYLVMDYLPGGDLMSLLMKKDILTEEEARFYIAEMILAIETCHNLNSIHRDLKPDNILIDKYGHIQLSDFGLSKLSDNNFYPMSSELEKEKEKLTVHSPSDNKDLPVKITLKKEEIKNRKKNRLVAFSTVGTPDYIAPEVFSQHGYSQEVDWWSVGVILFEMLVGYPPFFSENPSDTCQKIVSWKKYFTIPIDANLSLEADNLIRRLVTVPEARLGLNGAEEIKKHPFFKGVEWDNIRYTKAPFIPELSSEWDIRYFDTFPEQEPFYPPEKKKRVKKEFAFIDYTWKNDDSNRGGLLHAIEVLEAVKITQNKENDKVNVINDYEPLQTEDDDPSSSANYLETFENQKSINPVAQQQQQQQSSATERNKNTIININSNVSKTQTPTQPQNTSKAPAISNTKQNVNIIQLSKDTKSSQNTSKSPELKPLDKKLPSKGINIIPIRHQAPTEKISPRVGNSNFPGKTTTNFGLNTNNSNISPKGITSLKFPANSKSPNQSNQANQSDVRTQFEIKNSTYKSPSPGKGTTITTTSTLNKYIKKSPDGKK